MHWIAIDVQGTKHSISGLRYSVEAPLTRRLHNPADPCRAAVQPFSPGESAATWASRRSRDAQIGNGPIRSGKNSNCYSLHGF